MRCTARVLPAHHRLANSQIGITLPLVGITLNRHARLQSRLGGSEVDRVIEAVLLSRKRIAAGRMKLEFVPSRLATSTS